MGPVVPMGPFGPEIMSPLGLFGPKGFASPMGVVGSSRADEGNGQSSPINATIQTLVASLYTC